ncbi:MAG: MFS transporter [Candidatus Bathyarchaeia archaeon]
MREPFLLKLALARGKILQFSLPIKVLNKNLKLIFASNLVGSFGDGLYAYLLPYYMKETLKASPVEVGILYALASLTAAFTLFVAGILADKYDRKKIMIAGWVLWVPAPLIFSFAKNWVQMLPGMVLWGVWLGGPTSTAYIVTAADKSRLTLTFTVISSSWSLGYIFSPALGGYMAGTVGMRIVFYLAFILYTLAGLTLAFISSQHASSRRREASEDSPSSSKLLRTRKLTVISAFFASIMFVLMMFRPFVPQFLADAYHFGDFEIGVLGSMAFFGSAVLGIFLGISGDKWGKEYALAASMISSSISLILMLMTGNFYILAIAFFFAGASYIIWSLMSAIIGPQAPEPIRAQWISVPQTVSMFTSTLAPYIGGILYSASIYYPFIIAVLATLILAIYASFKEL